MILKYQWIYRNGNDSFQITPERFESLREFREAYGDWSEVTRVDRSVLSYQS